MAEKKASTKKKAGKTSLVIVESPAKAKTIEKYLGPGYTVKASMGHLIDLPKSRLAIDVEHGFTPEYITVRGRAKLLKELQRDAKKVDEVLLASDNDREGESIAWHLKNAFDGKTKAPIKRIVFNEITYLIGYTIIIKLIVRERRIRGKHNPMTIPCLFINVFFIIICQ